MLVNLGIYNFHVVYLIVFYLKIINENLQK